MKRFITILMLLLTFGIYAQAQVVVEHPWSKKRVAYLGDSITDPRQKASHKKYWKFLQEWLGITPYVYGVSGRQWNDIPNQASKLLAEHGHDFDAIMIFMGTNDFNSNVKIGEWFTESDTTVIYAHHSEAKDVKRKMRRPIADIGTFRGRINSAMILLKETFPEKQIVLLTPIHRGAASFSSTNIQPSEAYANGCGEYIDAYVQSIREAGEIWSVPVIDLYSLCGLFPMSESNKIYFSRASDDDLLHPGELGHERIAHTLMWQLFSLPCHF